MTPPPLKLSDLALQLEMLFEEQSAYLERNTNEIILLSQEVISAADDDELLEEYSDEERKDILIAKKLNENPSDFLPLPYRDTNDDWTMMSDFSYEVDSSIGEQIRVAIEGSGAFRLFRHCIREHGVEKHWLQYKDEKLKAIAREWCEENGVGYEDDGEEKSGTFI